MCRSESLTLREIASQLDRPPGSLSQPATMLAHHALVLGKRKKAAVGRRGARTFRFNSRWKSHLEEAKALEEQSAWSIKHRDLLVVTLADTARACDAIAKGIAEIEWGAQLGGEVGGLILATSADPDGAGTIRVMNALGPVAARLTRLRLSDVMSAKELRGWAERVGRGSVAAGELSSGPQENG